MNTTIAALLALAAPAAAQPPASEPGTEQQATDPAALQKELEGIQRRLAAAEQQALADPEVQKLQHSRASR